MPGTALENFNTFMLGTGPSIFSGPDEFLNEVTNQSYIFPRFLKGKGRDKVFQGGSTIRDVIMLETTNTTKHYLPNEEFEWVMPDIGTQQEIKWKFTMGHMSWTEQSVRLNINGDSTVGNQKVQYKRYKNMLETNLWTDMLHKVESSLLADPNGMFEEMEGAGKTPYSVPAFVTEDTTNYHYDGWTTVMGIDPAEKEPWRPVVHTYDATDIFDLSGTQANGLIDAFDRMGTDQKFVIPDYKSEVFKGVNEKAFRNFIACSHDGFNQYKRVLRASNDTTMRATDMGRGMQITFDGIDIVPITHLNDAEIYDSGATGTSASEDNETREGARYFWINGNYMTPIFHTENYFKKMKPFFLPHQPETYICPVKIWWNLFCHSRRHQGIIAPAA